MYSIIAAVVATLCWIRIVVSPLPIALGIVGLVAWQFGTDIGIGVAFVFVPIGLVPGMLWARHITRQHALVEYAHGLTPLPRRDATTRSERSARGWPV